MMLFRLSLLEAVLWFEATLQSVVLMEIIHHATPPCNIHQSFWGRGLKASDWLRPTVQRHAVSGVRLLGDSKLSIGLNGLLLKKHFSALPEHS